MSGFGRSTVCMYEIQSQSPISPTYLISRPKPKRLRGRERRGWAGGFWKDQGWRLGGHGGQRTAFEVRGVWKIRADFRYSGLIFDIFRDEFVNERSPDKYITYQPHTTSRRDELL